MSKQADVLKRLKGYKEHGVRFSKTSSKAARGACPFCGSSTRDPFEMQAKTLAWKCHSCGEHGKFQRFLSMRMVEYQRAFTGVMAEVLAEDRSLKETTLLALGIGWDEKSKLYMIPLFRGTSVSNIQRYSLQTGRCFGTTGGHRGLMTLGGVADAKAVHVAEGAWDVGALWEGIGEGGIIGVAGAVSGQDSLLVAMCQGKAVTLVYDHDDGGLRADKKSRELLQGHTASLQSVHWPTDRKASFDARDLWKESKLRPKIFRAKLKQFTLTKARPEPKNRVVTGEPAGTPAEATQITQEQLTGKGSPRDAVIAGFQEWLSMPDPEVLDILFGTIFANRLPDAPVWLFIVGPSGCGKSELVLSLIGAPLIYSLSTLTPPALISGKNSEDGQDPSIIPKLDKKVLAIKDFTPILSMKETDQQIIFSVLRDAYDGLIEKPYGNGLFRRYTSLFGIIAGVTSQIDQVMASHSIVGQRFIKYRMREACKINAGEDAIDSVLDRLSQKRSDAMRVALRLIALAAIDRPVLQADVPDLSSTIKTRIKKLAMWTANVRAAVNINQYTDEHVHMPTAEIGTRLALQFAKLAMGIAIFRGKKAVSIDEFNVVVKVARDSVPDIVQEIIRLMYIHHKDEWTKPGELLGWLKLTSATITNTLERLVSLGVVEKRAGERRGLEYRISVAVKRLMEPLNLYAKERRWRRVGRKKDV